MRVLALLATAAIVVPVIDAGPIFRIDDLGTLGGSQMSGAAINAGGQVVGTGTDWQGYLRAFSSTNGPADITPAWANSASANGISSSGQVIGTTYVNGNSQATLWSNGTAQQIGGLGGPDSYATAINNSQQVAGMATTAGGQGHAAVYSNGAVQDVNLPGANWSSAYGINDSGTVAGTAMLASGVFGAYTWSALSGFTTLGTLGGMNSYASAINSQGQVIGNSSTATGYPHAFVWDDSGMQDLGTLGGNFSYAYGINDSGEIVGYASVASGNHAFLYMDGVMFDLNLLIADLAGWELTAAYGINDAGQITGTGLVEGVEHAFRLDPVVTSSAPMLFAASFGPLLDPVDPPAGLDPVLTPEPGSIALVMAGGILLAARSLRKRKA
jgi:probable HAF family extracellular repeat protein